MINELDFETYLSISSKKIGIYNPIDYKNNPKKYCGMKLHDNPYYDM